MDIDTDLINARLVEVAGARIHVRTLFSQWVFRRTSTQDPGS